MAVLLSPPCSWCPGDVIWPTYSPVVPEELDEAPVPFTVVMISVPFIVCVIAGVVIFEVCSLVSSVVFVIAAVVVVTVPIVVFPIAVVSLVLMVTLEIIVSLVGMITSVFSIVFPIAVVSLVPMVTVEIIVSLANMVTSVFSIIVALFSEVTSFPVVLFDGTIVWFACIVVSAVVKGVSHYSRWTGS